MTVSGAAGAVLKGVFGVAARVRPTAKPLHPRGQMMRGTVRRSGLGAPAVGVQWIDEPGTDEVLVRLSRAVGLPSGWPDIFGIALRVPVGPNDHGDVLLASTGLNPVGRYVLLPGRDPDAATYSSLIPYRTSSGPLLVGARAAGEGAFELACAGLSGPWRPFGRLELAESPDGDLGDADGVGPSFDPVLNQLPGLEYYPWAARLREGAYSAARGSRR